VRTQRLSSLLAPLTLNFVNWILFACCSQQVSMCLLAYNTHFLRIFHSRLNSKHTFAIFCCVPIPVPLMQQKNYFNPPQRESLALKTDSPMLRKTRSFMTRYLLLSVVRRKTRWQSGNRRCCCAVEQLLRTGTTRLTEPARRVPAFVGLGKLVAGCGEHLR
jgi:hypothetical protein